MGSFIVSTLFISALVALMVHQMEVAIRAHWKAAPRWLAMLLFVLIMLALLLVPMDSYALVQVFRRAGR